MARILGTLEFKALTCYLFEQRSHLPSLSTRPYLGLSIIAPVTLSHLGTVVAPVGLSVRLSGVNFVVVPALLTLICCCVVPAGLGVALGVAFIIIPATLGLLWVFFVLGLLLCGSLFLLQRGLGVVEHCGGLESKRKGRWEDGRKMYCRRPEEQLGCQGLKVCNKGHDPGLCGVS